MDVPCPKCKGGCNLCRGVGVVPEAVARLYEREEQRPTRRMGERERSTFLADEVPTRPDVVGKADRSRRMSLMGLIVLVGLALGVAAGLVARLLSS